MKKIAALFTLALLALGSSPAWAQNQSSITGSVRTVTTQSWVEEWDAAQGRWVKVADSDVRAEDASLPTVVTTIANGEAVTQTRSAARYAKPAPASSPSVALAQFGPFVVATPDVALMVGSTGSRSPQDFDAMLRNYPGISTIKMIEAPGTSNDIANLALGRRIREAGIATHVPHDGSVRSGAVELFLAGQTRVIEDGAEFAVHSWLDNHGREADDFAADHPAHRLYLDYYVEMGMTEAQARDFYAMTNSVPHASARWLEAQEMRRWIAPRDATPYYPSVQRYAAREVEAGQVEAVNLEAFCDFCKSVQASLVQSNARLQAMPLELIALNTVRPVTLPTMGSNIGPKIGYADVTGVKVAWAGTSLLDS